MAQGDTHDGMAEKVGQAVRTPRADQHGVAVEDLQRLWAPWRFGYIAGGEPVEGCVFCVLPARDPAEDRENLILHRGERAYVVFNAYPYNPGHLMVVPYVHEADLETLDAATAAEVWDLTRLAVQVLKQRLSCQGANVGLNLGAAGGAGIAAHLHVHVVPRWVGDTNFISVIGASRVLPRALEEMYDEIAPGFRQRPGVGHSGSHPRTRDEQ